MTLIWFDVADAADVLEDAVFAATVRDLPLALFRLDGLPYALHDLCPHGMARFSNGFVDGDCVECPLHQGLVDIRTGAPRGAPITTPTRSFPAREVNGRIEIGLPT